MNPQTGILFKILSVVLFVSMFACIKGAGDAVPVGEIVFFRSLFALPPILLWVVARGGFPERLRPRDRLGHLWRGVLGVSAMSLGFVAVGLLPFPEVIAIGYASPLFATVLAAMFLGERLRAYRLTAIALGLAGVLLVLSPRLSLFGGPALERVGDVAPLEALGALAALSSAFLAALAQVFARRLVLTETTAAIVFWFTITSTALSLLTLPFGWRWPPPEAAGLLVCAGLLGGVGQILLTESYRHAEMAVIAPFEYVSMLLSLAIGWFVFGETPTRAMIGGAILVVIAGLVILRREHQLGLERARARAAAPTQG